jgi:outer membrane receptor protein involved in Fe transport
MRGGSELNQPRSFLIQAALLVTLLLISGVALAGTTGKIAGVIKDKDSGERVPGAAISIVGTPIGTLSNDEGEFVILNVPVGTYALRCQLVGYGSIEVAGLHVSADLTTSYEFELRPLTIVTGEVVTVRAERPLIQQDQTASLTIADKEYIQQLPTRGYQDVVGLKSGVVAFKENPGQYGIRGNREIGIEPAMNIRGGRQSDVAYYLDGFSQQDPLTGLSTTAINNNAIEEVQVVTGGFNAEYGKVSAGVINVTTREGSSDYAGNLELITDNFQGESYDYNVYAFDIAGPITPAFTDMSFYLSGERRWQADREPRSTAGGILPSNYRDGYTWQGKLRYNVSQLDDWREYRHSYYFVPEHMPRYIDRNNSAYLKLTHSLSVSTFYEASINYFVTERKRGDGVAFDNLFDYARPHDNIAFDETGLFRPPDDPETEWDDSYVFNDYLHRKSSYYGFRFDLTSQVSSVSEIKFGGEFQRHTLRYYRHLWPSKVYFEWVPNGDGTDSTYQLSDLAWIDVDNYGYDITGSQLLDNGLNSAKHPYEISLYFQDKFEWEGLIINGGLRYDFFDPNTPQLKNEYRPLDPNSVADDPNATDDEIQKTQTLDPEDLVDSGNEHQLSPRIGVAYPVSDKTHFRFSFGKFFQRPELQYLYGSYDYLEYMTNTQPYYYAIGNPNLKPEETTAYEIGLTHRLGDNTRLDLTAYYKDVRNLTEVIKLGAFPKAYPTYRNRDFGTIKGFETNLKMRRTNSIALDLSYTFAIANGTGSYASTQSNIAWYNENRPLSVSPLDYDQRHKFTGVIDIRAGKGEGPKFGSHYPLENTGLNIVVNMASGTPYTAAQIYNEVTLESVPPPSPLSRINSRYGPWTYRVDMKLNRGFKFMDLDFDAYLWVINVFDRENVVDVYEGTGKPDETGWLATNDGQNFLQDWSEPTDLGMTGEELYELRQNDPRFYDTPRQIRLGLRMSF